MISNCLPQVSAPGQTRARFSWRTCALLLLTAVPIVFIAAQVVIWTRNIPIWDEFDTALDLLFVLSGEPSAGEVLDRLLALQNEHRTFVSRLIFAVGYWLTGGINFVVLAYLGNLFLVGVFWRILASVPEWAPRLRLAAVFSLAVFQLQHHESLFWAGSSIDHFLVVFAATLALTAIVSRAKASLPLACVFGFVATFSLAQGLLVWPIGAALLWLQRRPRALLAWLGAAAGSVALFLAGFSINPGHPLPGRSDLAKVIDYWLTLVGSSPALENVDLAPWIGGLVVLATLGILAFRPRPSERLPLAVIAWCLGALALIAWGRGGLAREWAPVTSRYVILSSIPFALTIWILLERALPRLGRRADLAVGAVAALLVAFNLAANQAHEEAGRVFARYGEMAVEGFHRHGTFALSQTQVYPDPERADALIRAVQERGIYRLPPLEDLRLSVPEPIVLHDPEEISNGCYFIEEVQQDGAELRVRGWAFRPDHTTYPGEVAVVFRSEDTAIAFEAVPQMRPDVAEAFERVDVTHSGFELRIPRSKLPPGRFGIGIGFDVDDSAEYMMTANTIVIPNTPAITMH